MKLIPLSQGLFAMVDDADFEAVSQFKWSAVKKGRRFYASRAVPKAFGIASGRHQLLHQFLMPGVLMIDHRDGNGLNNQRHNIRAATSQQNQRGFQRKKFGATSKFRGVCWDKQSRKWQALIRVNYKQIPLGYFEVEEDAARARDTATLKYYGPDAHFNFPL